MKPLSRFWSQVCLRGIVSQCIVGDPSREVVVECLRVDDPIRVYEFDFGRLLGNNCWLI